VPISLIGIISAVTQRYILRSYGRRHPLSLLNKFITDSLFNLYQVLVHRFERDDVI
jgi:hypothetical protein